MEGVEGVWQRCASLEEEEAAVSKHAVKVEVAVEAAALSCEAERMGAVWEGVGVSPTEHCSKWCLAQPLWERFLRQGETATTREGARGGGSFERV